MTLPLAQISPIVAGLIGAFGGVLVVAPILFLLLKSQGKGMVNAAQQEAENIRQKAQLESDGLRQKGEADARKEAEQIRKEAEKTAEEILKTSKETEGRLTKREDNLDKKLEMLTQRENQLQERDGSLQKKDQQLQSKLQSASELLQRRHEAVDRFEEEKRQELLRITNLSIDDAKREALVSVERSIQHEAGAIIKSTLERAEEEAREKAQKITLQAIQRFASDHTSESTVSTVDIPSDEMKGRVIGREGRNIRAFEKATGVDVIVDDTPGAVVVSCFDPVRRAVAAETLRRLIDDGRIHPARIEELHQQVLDEVQQKIIKAGKDACIEANVQGLHPKAVEMVGRLFYRTSYGQNILRHSIEVAALCQVIAEELGMDGTIARRCGFLHDIGKAMDHEAEGGHPAIGMEFLKKLGEKEEILNATGGHHDDIPHTTPYTAVVMAADAISGARPGARRETLERYVKRLEQLEGIAKGMKGVKEAFAIQAGREVRVVVDPARVDDVNCAYLAREIAKRVSEEVTFPGEIRITILREMRTMEFAR